MSFFPQILDGLEAFRGMLVVLLVKLGVTGDTGRSMNIWSVEPAEWPASLARLCSCLMLGAVLGLDTSLGGEV